MVNKAQPVSCYNKQRSGNARKEEKKKNSGDHPIKASRRPGIDQLR